MPRLSVSLLLTAAFTTVAAAQTYQRGLRGAVRDADGLVPGAEVILVNGDTTLSRRS